MANDLTAPGGRDLAELEDWLNDLATNLSPAEINALRKRVATKLRFANAARIKANLTPDGGAMTPRRQLRSRRIRDELRREKRPLKRKLMFQRAIKPGYLRKETPAGEANVGFVGAMARIMRVHHYGLKDTITRDPGSKEVQYDARPVLGITEVDRHEILDLVLEHLTGQPTIEG